MNKFNTLSVLFQQNVPLDKVQIAVPGKLFITGEYAILSPKQPAILIAVNQYLTAHISANTATKLSVITSELPNLTPIKLDLTKDNYGLNQDETQQWQYVISAVRVAVAVIKSYNISLRHFDLRFETQLINEAGLKFGLGSSGAVTVATIRSLLAYHGLLPKNNELIFRLAAIALLRLDSSGSLGDVAAISHGGWIYYQAFDREWLRNLLKDQTNIVDLLLIPWPDLRIESLLPPHDLSLKIGWTQHPASTDDLVGQLIQQIPQLPDSYYKFLQQSARSVENMRLAFRNNNIPNIQQEIRRYRRLLLNLQANYQLNIETQALRTLVEIAEANHYAAKSSGAGGGDCGIAVGNNKQLDSKLDMAWQEQGILPLALSVAPPIKLDYI